MDNEFRKDKLNNGCIVQLRTGERYIYLENAKTFGGEMNILISLDEFFFININDYDENLKHEIDKRLDIMKICNYRYAGDNLFCHFGENTKGKLWTAIREAGEKEDILEEITMKKQKLQEYVIENESLSLESYLRGICVKTNELNELVKRYNSIE